MKFAVVRFPGSNCDQDCYNALKSFKGADADYVWHKDSSLEGFDAVALPGGFSYGDYLRCGAIARFSPIMKAVKEFAAAGKPVIGICNGFQILCESGLLPGALVRNRDLHFLCEYVHLRVEQTNTIFTSGATAGSVLRIPVAHGEGSYNADAETLAKLNSEGRVLLRYSDAGGNVSAESNPNGSLENIAGICNEGRNVFGLMPHPERACESLLGSADGRVIFQSIIDSHTSPESQAAA